MLYLLFLLLPFAGGAKRLSGGTTANRSIAIAVCSLLASGAGLDIALAKRGGGAPPPPPPILDPVFPPPGPLLPDTKFKANGFDILGLVQNVTVTGGCPANKKEAGGTVTIDGVVITIPTNTIVQFPAHTLKWSEVVCPPAGAPPIAIDGTGGGAGGSPNAYPSIEMHVIGNIISPAGDPPTDATPAGAGSKHIGALVYVSQHSLESGSGYISAIDYNDGSIYVTNGGGPETRLLINDPGGRFGLKSKFPDRRFSVDDENPTIKAADTGYPMCVPRIAPPALGDAETDNECPQKNRPKFTKLSPCRDFAAASIKLPSRVELTQPAAEGAYCNAFVMKAVDDDNLPGV